MYYHALLESSPQILQELLKICERADVLISSNSMRFGRIVHELSKIPFVSIRVGMPLFSEYGKEDYTRSYQEYRNEFDTLRIRLGLSPLNESEGPGRSPQLALFAISQALLPPEHAWLKQYHHIIGNFFMDIDSWEPDPSLVSFLQAGPPPIVISLGSIVYDDPTRLSELFLDAIEITGCRAVFLSSWSGLAKNISLPETVYRADFIPFTWLFPRSACVVYHAGVGTTVEALRAGIPSVLIPHMPDQFEMAQRALELGFASKSFTLQDLDSGQLSAAIVDTLTHSNYKIEAERIGKQIEADQGVRTARILIERFVTTVNGR
jgi:sterol 3beta-glucosyltransferase